MDPLSIAASVAGIIAAAASIAKAISPYASSLKTLPPIALRVRSEIVSTQFLLGALQNLTHNLETSLPSRTGLIDIDHLEWVFTDGVLIFSELESTVLSIEPPGERLGGVSRMTWVRSETILKGLLERLGLFKESVLLLLNILQWYSPPGPYELNKHTLTHDSNSDSQASLNQQALHSKVDALRTGDEHLARRMMNIEDAFNGLSVLEKSSTACFAKNKSNLGVGEGSTRPDVRQEADTPGDESCAALDLISNEQVTPTPSLDSTAVPDEIPVFTFDTVLQNSRAYQRSRVDRSMLPSHATAAQTNLWSIFSGITLSDISVIAAIALPIYPKDISNPQHYDFTRPDDAPNLRPRKTNTTMSRRSRHIQFTDIDLLWKANNEYAIGDWSQTRAKVFRLRELRYEFTCKVPVIFVTWPDYRGVGPVPTSPVIFLTGDDESRQNSFLSIRMDPKSLPADEYPKRLDERPILSPPDQPRASWLLLLEIIQNMESKSSMFMEEWRRRIVNPIARSDRHHLDGARTIVAAIQMRILSWDSMPQEVPRGYGTTTWSHVVELLAMLGVYWVALDIPRNVHRAKGNGFEITSRIVSGLGIFLDFARSGPSLFQERRVVPTEDIKDLAFGHVHMTATTRRRGYNLSLRKLEGLQELNLEFGTPESIVASLRQLGCNSRAVQCFSRDNLQRSRLFHLFPVLFEVVGMLGRVYHIRNTPFRFLPNPTMFHWDQSISFTSRLLESFRNRFRVHIMRQRTVSQHFEQVHALASELTSQPSQQWIPKCRIEPEELQLLHDALDFCDTALLGFFTDESLSETAELESDSEKGRQSQDMIRTIISRHLQEVLLLLNEDEATSRVGELSQSDKRHAATSTTIAEMDEAPPESATSALMDIYFDTIRPKVMAGLSPPNEVVNTEMEAGTNLSRLSSDEIWCTLIFRMVCWLKLHDFDRADVQRSQSSLHGSRLKVFIS